MEDFDPADFRNRNRIFEALATVVQILVRNITNDNSPENAARILFREQRLGSGSRRLLEYLDNLPGIFVDLNYLPDIYADPPNALEKLQKRQLKGD